MSRLQVAPHFQNWIGQPSSLDRCTKCSAPRSAHGVDWTCPTGLPRQRPAPYLVVGGLLVVGSVVLRFATGDTQFAAQTAAYFVGIILVALGMIMLADRISSPDR
jgi:hypothetical protein